MPTLNLRDKTKIAITAAGNKYYTFDDYPGTYIYDDGVHMKWEDKENATLPNTEYDGQVAKYLAGELVLTRGLPRQHPLFFEIFHLEVLMPLGAGELPSWATNNTCYIPFGADFGSAKGVAMGQRGMGPGDDQQMVADIASLQNVVDYCCGLVTQVTAGRGVGVAFYNPGEIQVRGPVVKGLKIIPVMLDGDALPKVPSDKERVDYEARFGGLRHRATVAALAAHGHHATAVIRGNEKSRNEHAEALFGMRRKLRGATEPMMRELVKNMPPKARPMPEKTTDDDFFDYLDSSINRDAHDAYLAAVVSGAESGDAANAGRKAGIGWITRYCLAFEAKEEPFPPGWQKML